MFKKTKVRQILELLHKDLSAREISKTMKLPGAEPSSILRDYSTFVP